MIAVMMIWRFEQQVVSQIWISWIWANGN